MPEREEGSRKRRGDFKMPWRSQVPPWQHSLGFLQLVNPLDGRCGSLAVQQGGQVPE